MLKKNCIILFLIIIGFSTACNDNLKHCKTGTEVLLKDSITLKLLLEFDFKNKRGVYEFRTKEKEVLFAIRLALRQHKSTRLKGMGRKNVQNAIRNVCRQLLNEKVAGIKIREYTFTKN